MNHRRLAPWLVNFATASGLGIGLGLWLRGDVSPAPWPAIIAVVALVIIITVCVAWDDRIERREILRREADKLRVVGVCLRCGRSITAGGPACCARPLPSNVP